MFLGPVEYHIEAFISSKLKIIKSSRVSKASVIFSLAANM
jgi:hypothetical protein